MDLFMPRKDIEPTESTQIYKCEFGHRCQTGRREAFALQKTQTVSRKQRIRTCKVK